VSAKAAYFAEALPAARAAADAARGELVALVGKVYADPERVMRELERQAQNRLAGERLCDGDDVAREDGAVTVGGDAAARAAECGDAGAGGVGEGDRCGGAGAVAT
jgi:hypothetical protein